MDFEDFAWIGSTHVCFGEFGSSLTGGGLSAGEFCLSTDDIDAADFGDLAQGGFSCGDLLLSGSESFVVVGFGFGDLLNCHRCQFILSRLIFNNLLTEGSDSLIIFRLSLGYLFANGFNFQPLGINFGRFDRSIGI